MRSNNRLYGLAFLLALIWAIVYVGFNIGGLIHFVLLLAICIYLFRVIGGRRTP